MVKAFKEETNHGKITIFSKKAFKQQYKQHNKVHCHTLLLGLWWFLLAFVLKILRLKLFKVADTQILTKISKKMIFFILIPLVSKFNLDFKFRNCFSLICLVFDRNLFLGRQSGILLKNNQVFYWFYFLLHLI